MYRILVLALVFALTSADPDDFKACGKIFRFGNVKCCKSFTSMMNSKIFNKDDFKDCFKYPPPPPEERGMGPPSCDMELCFAKKNGIASDDGNIDKKALQDFFEKQFESEPDLVESLIEKCVKGDLDKYAPKDFCDLIKLHHCMDVQLVKNCKEWDDNGQCSGMKNAADECRSKFP